jgi:hypothetical protein
MLVISLFFAMMSIMFTNTLALLEVKKKIEVSCFGFSNEYEQFCPDS